MPVRMPVIPATRLQRHQKHRGEANQHTADQRLKGREVRHAIIPLADD